MKRLVVLAVAAAAVTSFVPAAGAHPRCPDLVCGTLHQCIYTVDVIICP
ncbi:MAG TPA: hypothetical protein VF519_12940 [Mycobacteriales bacterium]|jgi:uncharacterized membrane protein (DUF2068 family)